MRKGVYMYLSVVVVLMMAASPILAQAVAGFGGLSGVVRDGSGAVVVNARVVVANDAKGIRRNLTTNEAGVFNAPALVPAAGYSVSVNADGFQTHEGKNIEILVGQNISINIVVQVAATTTTVEVSEATPVVEQTRTGVSQVVSSRQILNLPINGRRVDSFVLMTPAVVADGTFGLVSFRGIAGGNAFLTDGNDTTNQFYNENAGRTRVIQISQDAVQEFEVLSAGYSAEYGRASGGVINTVTRSGANQVHGTGYWFFRNRTLNATDRYSTINPPEARHQLGGSIGGAIRKDKLFYFFSAESSRRKFPLIASLTRPPLFDANGKFAGTCTATPAQCAAALKFTERQFQVLDRRADSELGFGKLDWRPTEKHSISASFNYLRWISPNGIQTQAVLNNGNGVGNNANSTVRTRYGRLSWTSILKPTMVNELRYGWFKDRLFDDVSEALIPPETGRITLTVQGQTNLGVSDTYPRLNPSENRHQIADNFTWTLSKHTLKIGFDYMSTRDYNDILRNRNGTYSYPSWTAFAQDLTGNTTGAKRWQTFSQRFGNPVVDATLHDIAWYAQDQFRMTRNLTLNYGVRYEFTKAPQPPLVNPDYPQTGRIRSPNNNFAPRFGFAYAFNDNKTVFRGGYGIFYARIVAGFVNTLFLENGIYQKNISLNASVAADLAAGPVFPRALPGIDRNPPAGTVSVTFQSPDWRNPYTEQGDFGLERQLTQNMGLTVSYIWSRGLHLSTVRDLNMGPTRGTATYRINDFSGNQVGSFTTPIYLRANRVDQRWQRVNMVDHGGNSYYNAMVVQLRKRYSKGLEASISYTWSHAIDFNQGGGSNNIFFSGGPGSLFNGDYRGDKSSSALDRRHGAGLVTVWQPTISKSSSWVARYLINNWQLSQITSFASSGPATAVVSVPSTPYTDAPFQSLNGFGGSSRVPFIPAASMLVDQIYRTDARITKIIPFKERYQIHLNFEAFNAFNHISNSSVNTQAYQATAGVLIPTARLGEGSASQGFPDGTNARRAQVSARFVF